ncbi:MAG: hypothetical protein DA328_09285 [Nitrososphaeraceae archaeon]|nr:hypothetical protein [Nitrososphaeraceae archaeon]
MLINNHSQNYQDPQILINNHSQNYQDPQILINNHSQNYQDPQILINNHSQNYQDPQIIINILQNILNDKSYKILLSLLKSPRSALEIHDKCNLPISSIYKELNKLKKNGLIKIAKIHIGLNGKKVISYKSNITSLNLVLNQNEFSLSITR